MSREDSEGDGERTGSFLSAPWTVQRVREQLDRFWRAPQSFMVIAAVLIGLGGGAAAIGFRYLIEGSTFFFSGGTTTTASGFAQLSWWWILLMPAAGGLVVGCIAHYLSPEVRGTGVPEVMEAIALRGGHVRKRVGLTKALAVAACLGSGGSAGREGPIVHVGAAVGSTLGSLLRVPVRQLRTFVGCGAAAGIAATFNAPIAGAMFAGEVILGQFGVVSFSAIVISSVVATVLSHHFLGTLPAFVAQEFHLEHTYELFLYAAVGLLAAILGCFFIWLLQRVRRLFDKTSLHPVMQPAVGGLMIGLIALFLPEVMGVGYDGINQAMGAQMAWLLMIALLGGKLLATALTLGSGGSGGIFAPSLFLGAMLGGLAGTGFASAIPDAIGTTGSYALVAMGAMVAATTRSPITAIIIIFEITNNYTIILPLMIACILATLVAGQIVKPSIYHAKLLERGIDLTRSQDINLLRAIPVDAAHIGSCHMVRPGTSLDEILDRAIETGGRHFLVVDREGGFAGMIQLRDLHHSFMAREELSGLVVAADLAHRKIPTLSTSDHLDLVAKLLSKTRLDALPVLTEEPDKKAVGVITREAVMEAYNRALLDRDLVGEAATLMVTAERTRSVDLGQDTALVELEAPAELIGKSLRELDLRRKYDAQVMLVRRRVGNGESAKMVREMPGPDLVIQKRDLLLLIGSPDRLKALDNS